MKTFNHDTGYKCACDFLHREDWLRYIKGQVLFTSDQTLLSGSKWVHIRKEAFMVKFPRATYDNDGVSLSALVCKDCGYFPRKLINNPLYEEQDHVHYSNT